MKSIHVTHLPPDLLHMRIGASTVSGSQPSSTSTAHHGWGSLGQCCAFQSYTITGGPVAVAVAVGAWGNMHYRW